jgi:serine/threonine-protein kinase
MAIARIAKCLGAAMLSAQTLVLAEPLPRFSAPSVWNQDITQASLHPQSASMIATLDGLGGFGGSSFRRMQIDFSLHVVHAAENSPQRTISAHPDGYYDPDCDPVGTAMPVPLDAAIEGQDGLICDNDNQDCHLLVVQGNTLYEAYRSTADGANQLQAQCLAIWRLDASYPPEGRGEHCTSADAAGFPIAPLMFNADDIAASLNANPGGDGDLGHAIRFIIRNNRMASDESLGGVGGRLYVRPASHAGSPSGPVGSLAFGSRLRLKDSFPLDNYPPAARVILNTFKRYGIVLADGGTITLTAESDRYTSTKWSDLGIDSRLFDRTPGARDVMITDFEVIDTGPRIAETWECVRSVIPEPDIFADGFEPQSQQ